MLAINPSGQLIITSNSKKEIPVTGVIFMENIYAMKCIHFALTGRSQAKSQIIDDTVKFAIQ